MSTERTQGRPLWANTGLTIVLALLSHGCAHRVVLKSDPPGARVRMIDESGKAQGVLGTTPIDLKNLPGDEVGVVELEKDGHLPKMVVVPRVANATLTVTVNLQPLTREYLAARNRRDFAGAMNANLGQMLKLQSAILAGNKPEVEKLEGQMKEEFAELSLFHSLMGHFFFMQGNFPEAQKRYEKALGLDPNNDEARSMLEQIRR